MNVATTFFEIHTEWTDAGNTVYFAGELDIASCTRLGAALVEIGEQSVTFDLHSLRFIDAAGIGEVLNAKAWLEREGRSVRIVGAHGIVRRVFEICALHDELSHDG